MTRNYTCNYKTIDILCGIYSSVVSLHTLQYHTQTANNPNLNCSQISPVLTSCTILLDIYCLLDTRYQLTARSPDSGLTVAVAVFTSVGMHDGDTAHQPPATRREAWQQPTRSRSYNVQLESRSDQMCLLHELTAGSARAVWRDQLPVNNQLKGRYNR